MGEGIWWNVFDADGDMVATDVQAPDELGALAQFVYSDDQWRAEPMVADDISRRSHSD